MTIARQLRCTCGVAWIRFVVQVPNSVTEGQPLRYILAAWRYVCTMSIQCAHRLGMSGKGVQCLGSYFFYLLVVLPSHNKRLNMCRAYMLW